MNFKIITAIALSASTLFATAQTPAKPQTETIILKGGTAHTGDGQVIENATIRIENGKIAYIGKADNNNPAGAKVIDVTGKQVYPGLIAPNTILGLSEIDAVRSTQDNSEVGTFNPNIRSVISYNTDSKIIPTIRTNGILLVETTPKAGVISGTSSVMELDGWNWEDAAYKTDIALHLNWPGMYRYSEQGVIEVNKDYDKSLDRIKDYFAQAKAYAQSNNERPANLKFDAMKGLFDKTKKLFVHISNPREIMGLVDFNKGYGFDLAIVSDENVLPVANLLKENHIPVILSNIHALPNQAEEDVYLPYKLPFLLKKAGVDFCLSLDGAWQQRNLPFLAGTSAAYGLTKEEALAAITSNTARILGIDKNVGTLAVGKDATIIVSTGDVLDMKTNNIEFAFIRGKQISLDNMQKALYQKYQAKYQDQK